jgi:hypothetical protein
MCMGTRSLVTFKVYDLWGATGSVNVNCKCKQKTQFSGCDSFFINQSANPVAMTQAT